MGGEIIDQQAYKYRHLLEEKNIMDDTGKLVVD
jgi:hypothetical protein